MGGANDPWEDDLFKRKQSADDLIGYVQSRYEFGSFSKEQKTQVIAVDAEYGIGKTFFLERLKMQLEKDFPVAYIDAWSDDFLGKPIIALAATLEEAFESLLPDTEVRRSWKKVAATAGKVAYIATKGAGLQLAKLAISSGAVAGIEQVVGGDQLDSDAVRDSINEGLQNTAKQDSDEVKFATYLGSELAAYREAGAAVDSLKSSLARVARAAQEAGKSLPVFVIIDELDRCRPDYALQFLEEIKHIFGIKEICFILGMNSNQLHRSIAHQYGIGFDGKSYLDRFIDRYFSLEFPDLTVLCRQIMENFRQKESNLCFVQSFTKGRSKKVLQDHEWTAMLLSHYNIGPRSVFKFFDRLQMAVYLLRGRPILMNYLCELIAADISGSVSDVGRPWEFFIEGGFHHKSVEIPGANFFRDAHTAFKADSFTRQSILREDSVLNEVLVQFAGEISSPGAELYGATVKRAAKFLFADSNANP